MTLTQQLWPFTAQDDGYSSTGGSWLPQPGSVVALPPGLYRVIDGDIYMIEHARFQGCAENET